MVIIIIPLIEYVCLRMQLWKTNEGSTKHPLKLPEFHDKNVIKGNLLNILHGYKID